MPIMNTFMLHFLFVIKLIKSDLLEIIHSLKMKLFCKKKTKNKQMEFSDDFYLAGNQHR